MIEAEVWNIKEKKLRYSRRAFTGVGVLPRVKVFTYRLKYNSFHMNETFVPKVAAEIF
jgi:hypothetical protein